MRFIVFVGFILSMFGCGDDDVTNGGDLGTDTGSTQAAIERGRYLVDNVVACPDCHTPRDSSGAFIAAEYLSGVECFARLPSGSCLNAPNLTNHETGLANRTDQDIERMIRDGVRPSATGDVPLFPAMPSYVFHNMTDSDLNAMVAYLRTIPGVSRTVPPSGPEFTVPAPANPLNPTIIPMPMEGYTQTERALRGRYLATHVGACMECHTRHIMGDPNVLDYTGFFQGGERFEIGLPVAPVSTNITSDPATGIGNWTVDDIVRAVREGSDPGGERLCPPMPAGPMNAYGGLTDEDALDIAHYIKSLPPAINEVEDTCAPPPM